MSRAQYRWPFMLPLQNEHVNCSPGASPIQWPVLSHPDGSGSEGHAGRLPAWNQRDGFGSTFLAAPVGYA